MREIPATDGIWKKRRADNRLLRSCGSSSRRNMGIVNRSPGSSEMGDGAHIDL
jgi:hypothetical protein